MAVFWFGWAKKLKNIFTKQQADTYYLQKNSNQLQTVAGPVNLRSSIELGTEIKAGYGGGSVKFIPEDNSTKTLQFYNANPNDTRRFNLLVPNPTAAQNPATKQYVDNGRQYIQVFSNTSTVYNNLDKIQLTPPADFTQIERNIPWIIQFDRIVKASGAYEGTISYVFMLPDRGKATFATSRMYYVSSSGNFEEGSRVGISIKVGNSRAYELKIQIWDQTKAIKNVNLYKPQS